MGIGWSVSNCREASSFLLQAETQPRTSSVSLLVLFLRLSSFGKNVLDFFLVFPFRYDVSAACVSSSGLGLGSNMCFVVIWLH